MPQSISISVKEASYLEGFTILISFSDGKTKKVDFSKFISTNHKATLVKYKDVTNFKKFKIEEGNIVWGKNWDLIFPIHQLYSGKIS
jgi:hypothetical protein